MKSGYIRAWVVSWLLLVASLFLSVHTGAAESAVPAKDARWKLAWSDEFNGPNGSGVDLSKWVFDVGGGGWGNEELEYYTNRPQNSHIEDGKLVIEALHESYTGADGVSRNYTSARLKTAGRFSQTYGRFEARIKIPFGQGMWPAFWMLGDDIEKAAWPDCGEIDIMENIGKEPSTVHGSIHGPGFSGDDGIEARYTLPGNRRFADDFHVFAVEWEPNAIRFYVDDELYVTRTRKDLPPGRKWVFDHPFFLLLNVAVGGDWSGNPDSTTNFPQTMLLDYVRVYKRSSQIEPVGYDSYELWRGGVRMHTAYLVVTILFAAMVAFSGLGKIRRDPRQVRVVHETVGVPLNLFPVLATCEFAGALGLVAGIWRPPLGIAAGVGLVLYFVGAIVSHVRVGDFKGLGSAVFMLVVAAGALVMRILIYKIYKPAIL